MNMEYDQFIASEFSGTAQLLLQMAAESTAQIRQVGLLLAECIKSGGKALICGNGGSAADAQHFAAELVGRYRLDRNPLAAVALTTDTSALTSISNDYGFEEIFARQVRALARPGDVVVGISTSGRSVNVITALQAARDCGAHSVALIGANILGVGGVAEYVITVPSTDAPRIQESHAVIIHVLCDIVEQSTIPPVG